MEGSSPSTTFEAKIKGIRFCLATRQEICKASISDCPISHASQLSNPFLGLPLETGKCESCGTAEPGQCEGHFGYIELPTPIYHPDHVSELKRMLSLICLKCLKMKNRKSQVKNIGVMEKMLSECCEETSHVSVSEAKTTDGAYYLELKVPSRRLPEGFWNFLEKYGFRYAPMQSRSLLPLEVMAILRKMPQEARKKLCAKGCFPQDGYIIQHLPVPPNCLSVPDVSDGISTMSSDYSLTLLKKVLRQVEIIKNSRTGMANFESHEIESNDLQAAVAQYLQFRGTSKASRDVDTRFGVNKEMNASSTKAWLEKMKTLFIRKGSGFSSRSVITGDPFKGVSEIGLPFEIAQKITFEERVNQHNMEFLQKLVDEKLCLTYTDGLSTYSLREGSKGHTFLRPGQVVHRRIMDGDIVFINRPPTTHKHSLQALSVYVHDDHTVKINPLICGPLSADFDGDCIHLFYPQSLEAKAEVLELFSVEKQLLSSHTGNFNLQLTTDSLLSLKLIFREYFLKKAAAQQLAMFVPNSLPGPAVVKSPRGFLWTGSQMLQMTLPPSFDCSGERHIISRSEVLQVDFNKDVMASIANDLVTSLFFLKGPTEVIRFFNSIQPLLMESLFWEGFSVSLRDLFIPGDVLESIQTNIQKISPLLHHLRASHSESIALQLDGYLRSLKIPVSNFILNSSAFGHLIDSKSESALSKVVQQIGFLGMQISEKGKFYSGTLVKDMSSLFRQKYPSCDDYPTEEFGLVSRPLFRGLDPYQEMVHSISSREVIVRSSRGLTEPGTLFKNLMAILRDIVICHDGTVRNMCSNSILQFEYGVNSANIVSEFCAGDPVGVLAATAMSNPAYKAVLDSSPSSNSSWEMMKEILLCGVSFKNDISDRRVILYLKNCDCGRKHCQENAALIVKNQLKKISLKDTTIEFLIEYGGSQMLHENSEITPSLVGHIHLNKTQLTETNISMEHIFEKCRDTITLQRKKKKIGNLFKRIDLSFSNYCSFCQSSKSTWADVPCVQFHLQGARDDLLERASHVLADTVCPVLLQTIIKGDPRVATVDVVWISPDTATWIRSPCKSPQGELALDVMLEKGAVSKSGDAWRVVMDSCLPVIHLIDTHRSIPYAIKQVQELLGISCAFEQAVRRLSTSVTMVTKGVLKDHLLLLGNSMTCAGTFIGFNAGGIKALSRTLNVQVPFMNATLFTPRKCFERAAEKCHIDNLSSIVASCAWGKHVSVGTGSPFEILWDTRKAELNPQKEIDVYNFLHLVNSSSRPEDMGTSCLGTEIDDLDQDDEFMGYDLSPEREGLDKPTFEDGVELGLCGDDNDELSKEAAKESQNGWSAWCKKVDSEENDWTKKTERSSWPEEAPKSSAWGGNVDSDENDWSKKAKTNLSDEAPNSSGWGKKVEAEENRWNKTTKQSSLAEDVSNISAWRKKVNPEEDRTKKAQRTSWSEEAPTSSAWGKKMDPGENNWNRKAEQSSWAEEVPSSSAWGKKGDSEENTCNKKAEHCDLAGEVPSNSAWGKKFESKTNNWMKKNEQGSLAADFLSSSAWGKNFDSGANDSHEKAERNSWSQEAPNISGWGKKADSRDNDWNKKVERGSSAEEALNNSTWGQTIDSEGNDWAKKAENSSRGDEVQSTSAWKPMDSDGDHWAKKDEQNKWGQSSSVEPHGASNWGAPAVGKTWGAMGDESAQAGQETKPKSSNDWGSSQKQSNESTWGSSKIENCSKKDVWAQQGVEKDDPNPQVDQESEPQPSNAWGSSIDWSSSQKQSNNPTRGSSNNSTWGSSKVENSSKKDGWVQRGGGKDDQNPQADQETEPQPSNAWGSSIDWSSSQKQSNDSAWGSSKVEGSSEKEAWAQRGRGRGRGWGRGGRSREGSQGQGPSNAGDWKTKRPRPVDDPSAPALFTVTRQRLDLFTAEEQDVLSEIEIIMKNIRRIMKPAGYNDGDPISPNDQKFVIDNVFNYHPDKAGKMGAGIDYIMVSRHGEFQDSRCFYAVSISGGKEDFSYRKCLENFIREKYPDKADAFTPKYFRKPQPRPGWNKDHRGPARGEAGTPPTWNNRESGTPGTEEAGTPGWNRDQQTPGPDDSSTPGCWNKDSGGGPPSEEAETQTPA